MILWKCTEWLAFLDKDPPPNLVGSQAGHLAGQTWGPLLGVGPRKATTPMSVLVDKWVIHPATLRVGGWGGPQTRILYLGRQAGYAPILIGVPLKIGPSALMGSYTIRLATRRGKEDARRAGTLTICLARQVGH